MRNLDFELLEDSGANILRDQFNNVYDIFGNCVEGPNTGFKLEKPAVAYWVLVCYRCILSTSGDLFN